MEPELLTSIMQSFPNFAGLIIALWFARSQSARQSETIDAQTRVIADMMREIIQCYKENSRTE